MSPSYTAPHCTPSTMHEPLTSSRQHPCSDIVLGIESSCDETAAAVYCPAHGMLSNVLFTQVPIHQQFGGVMPEVASRSHLEKIRLIVTQALEKAQVSLDDIATIAVTNKPGLPGSLLVGLCFAKGLAWSTGKKLVAVNHLEGHAFSSMIEHAVPFPHLCITASGGHTSLYLVEGLGNYQVLGQTIDDAAGEAFDKVAKLVGLPYPGGPVIEQRAREAGFIDYFSYPRPMAQSLDFSFSGLKTAVLYDLVNRGAYNLATKTYLKADDSVFTNQVASSLLVSITDIFIQKLRLAFKAYPHVKAVSFVGGVACNKYIKQRLGEFCTQHDKAFFTPSPQYCTDNGAMIAYVGAYKAARGEFSSPEVDVFQ